MSRPPLPPFDAFSAAAKEFGVTPGMMSKQVKQLEDELDVPTFIRRGGKGSEDEEEEDDGESPVWKILDYVKSATYWEKAANAQAPLATLEITEPDLKSGAHESKIAAFVETLGGGLADDLLMDLAFGRHVADDVALAGGLTPPTPPGFQPPYTVIAFLDRVDRRQGIGGDVERPVDVAVPVVAAADERFDFAGLGV